MNLEKRSRNCDLSGKAGPRSPGIFDSLLETRNHGRSLSRGISLTNEIFEDYQTDKRTLGKLKTLEPGPVCKLCQGGLGIMGENVPTNVEFTNRKISLEKVVEVGRHKTGELSREKYKFELKEIGEIVGATSQDEYLGGPPETVRE